MTAAATAVFSLADRAKVTARPAPERVRRVLAHHERTELTLAATRLPMPDPDLLAAMKAKSRAARLTVELVSADLDAATTRLAGLLVDQRRSRTSVWHRLLGTTADLDAEIADARRHRDILSARFGTAQDACRKAEATERAARRASVVAEVQAKSQGEAIRRAAHSRLAIIDRARRLLTRVPLLAYVGARRLLSLAARIEEAQERGYDPGPSASTFKIG